jgi:eukaryotic-like serine/threonine-protein kinase
VTDWRPLSGVPPRDESEARIDLDDVDRYEQGTLVGRGAMGEVHEVRDRRLGRDVARKRMTADGSEARFVREASILGRLDHPGVVPLHDLGRLPDGSPFYTMRRIRGRSLAEAIVQATDREARMRLLRPLLAAIETMAFVHQAGVVHRDLKPDHIFVGPFGEVQIVDWGLALVLGEGSDPVAGTEGFASPELRRGDAVDARTDVYSLGAILRAIVPPNAAPDLLAIAARAMEPDRERRYPDGQAFARDLEAWLDGRRVQAHEYTTRELLRRAAFAYRRRLAVAAIALVALAAVAVVLSARTARERDRAVAAEAAGRDARRDSEANLAKALLAEAKSASTAGQAARAEVFAVESLLRGGGPEALGILAGRPATSPALASSVRIPSCAFAEPEADGSILCMSEAISIVAPDGSVETSLPVRARAGMLLADGRVVYCARDDAWLWSPAADDPPQSIGTCHSSSVLSRGAAPSDVVLIGAGSVEIRDVDRSQTVGQRACRAGAATHGRFAAGWVAVACAGGGVEISRPGTSVVFDERPGIDATAIQWNADATRLAIGTMRGAVYLVDPQTGTSVRTIETGLEQPQRIAFDGSGQRIAVAGPATDVSVWDASSGVLVAKIPGHARGFRWMGAERILVVTDGLAETWAVAASHRPVVLTGAEGVSAIAVSRDGRWLAAAHGDGTVQVYEDLRLQRTFAAGPGVAKDVAFAPDASAVAVARSQVPGALIVSLADGTAETVGQEKLRRVEWLASGLLVPMPYSVVALRGHRWDLAWRETASWTLASPIFDAWSDGDDLVIVDTSGDAWRIGEGQAPLPIDRGGGPLVAVWRDRVLRGDADFIVAPGIGRFQMSERVTDLAWSPDGRWWAAGLVDGTVAVLDARDGTERLRLTAHSGQIARALFSPDSRTLYTASWDRTVRIWRLDTLDASPEALASEIRARWGRTLADVLP